MSEFFSRYVSVTALFLFCLLFVHFANGSPCRSLFRHTIANSEKGRSFELEPWVSQEAITLRESWMLGLSNVREYRVKLLSSPFGTLGPRLEKRRVKVLSDFLNSDLSSVPSSTLLRVFLTNSSQFSQFIFETQIGSRKSRELKTDRLNHFQIRSFFWQIFRKSSAEDVEMVARWLRSHPLKGDVLTYVINGYYANAIVLDMLIHLMTQVENREKWNSGFFESLTLSELAYVARMDPRAQCEVKNRNDDFFEGDFLIILDGVSGTFRQVARNYLVRLEAHRDTASLLGGEVSTLLEAMSPVGRLGLEAWVREAGTHVRASTDGTFSRIENRVLSGESAREKAELEGLGSDFLSSHPYAFSIFYPLRTMLMRGLYLEEIAGFSFEWKTLEGVARFSFALDWIRRNPDLQTEGFFSALETLLTVAHGAEAVYRSTWRVAPSEKRGDKDSTLSYLEAHAPAYIPLWEAKSIREIRSFFRNDLKHIELPPVRFPALTGTLQLKNDF